MKRHSESAEAEKNSHSRGMKEWGSNRGRVASLGKNSATPLRASSFSYSRFRGVPLGVHRFLPLHSNSDLPAYLLAVDFLMRREPDEDEEEDEDEDDGNRKEDEDDDDDEGEGDDGYSE